MHLFFDLETADTLSLLSDCSDFCVFLSSTIDFSFGSLMRHVGRLSAGERNKIKMQGYFFLCAFVPRPSLKDLHLAEGRAARVKGVREKVEYQSISLAAVKIPHGGR